ncbi:MAG: AAA family ATPase, partial [Candidatus Anstonellales archaeon]
NGTGKTLLAKLIAKEFNLSLCRVENIASSEELSKYLRSYDYENNLFNTKKLVLIDELENIFNIDNKAIKILKEFLQKTKAIVYLTADNIYESKQFYDIIDLCLCVEFKKIPENEIEERLIFLNNKFNLGHNLETIQKIAVNANGDMRAALNDLISNNVDSIRDVEKNIFDFLRVVFKTKDIDTIRNYHNTLDLDLNLVKFWLLQNIPNEYEKPEEIYYALNFLSKSDIFDRRIMKRQSWKLLKYSIDLAILGTAIAKFNTYKKFTSYRFPTYFGLIKKINELRNKKRTIAEKIALKQHCSTKETLKDLMTYHFFAIKNSQGFADFYNLDQKEIELLKSLNKQTKR